MSSVDAVLRRGAGREVGPDELDDDPLGLRILLVPPPSVDVVEVGDDAEAGVAVREAEVATERVRADLRDARGQRGERGFDRVDRLRLPVPPREAHDVAQHHYRPAYEPPSTRTDVPVTKRAWSEQRNAPIAPKSSGRPSVWVGTDLARHDASPPCSSRMRSVSWNPGWIVLTVTPSAATSVASVFRNAVTPARAVFERMRFGIG